MQSEVRTRRSRRGSLNWLLALAAFAHLSAATGAAQEPGRRHTIITRVAAVTDAVACACSMSGISAPRSRNLSFAAVGFDLPLSGEDGSAVRISYTPELLPLIISTGTADDRLAVWRCGPRRYCGSGQNPESWDSVWTVRSWGFGVLPVAATVHWGAGRRMTLRTRLSAGAVRMSEPIPLAQGTRFNFILEAGAALDVRVSRSVRLTGGTLWNHISNGGLSVVNLGLDSRMIELGAVITR